MHKNSMIDNQLLQEMVIANYCKVPFLVINHLHRKKLDANREVNEAAQGNQIAINAWQGKQKLIIVHNGHITHP